MSSNWPSNSTTAILRPTSPRPPNETTRIAFGVSKGGICKLPAATGGRLQGPDSIGAVSSASGDPIADSVRLAWPAEASSIAELQRRSWAVQWPADLAELMLGSVSLAEMTESWRLAIERPPQAAFRVLVATDGRRVVGFASTMPSEDGDADPSADGAIEVFVVDPAAQHRGHGSRLLNACADTLLADGFSRACCWVNAGDDALQRFLTAAGWAADGATREIGPEDESVRLNQVRFHTALATDR
jgi:GNAT superfamily N-acetyltransferase